MKRVLRDAILLLGGLIWGWLGSFLCFLSISNVVAIIKEGSVSAEIVVFLCSVAAILAYIAGLVYFIIRSHSMKEVFLFVLIPWAVATALFIVRFLFATRAGDLSNNAMVSYLFFLR